MFAEAAMGDMRRQETMMKFAHELENREAQQLAQFSQTLFNTVSDIEKQRIENVRAEASALFYEDQAAVAEAEANHDAIRAEIDSQRDQDADMANAAFQSGAPYEVVKRFRSLSGHAKAAYAEQMALNAGAMYRE